ncbi:MAG: FumA C-terminus/TtdB family hydratase beta subunit [Candidatus Nanoarchaeia archaeon]
MSTIKHANIFPRLKNKRKFRLIESEDLLAPLSISDKQFLRIKPEALELIAETAFHDLHHFLSPIFIEELLNILKDSEASNNDKFVVSSLLENAIIASECELPLCQDTGVANVFAEKGEEVLTFANDRLHISKGILNAYRHNNFRYSMLRPEDIFSETNTDTNLPAQIEIEASEGNEYNFFFIAKGGGSSNKTFLFNSNKSILEEKKLEFFFREKLLQIGVSACPPYQIGIALGGTSPEMALKTAKLASEGFYDELPEAPSINSTSFRVPRWEQKILHITKEFGLGAQFGGKYFAHSVRFIRLPRHAATCHIAIAVSCNAHRNIAGKITQEGIFIEKLEKNPEKYLDEIISLNNNNTPKINISEPIEKICQKLSTYPVGTRISLSGPMIVARDIAHAKFAEMLSKEGKLPDYLKNHIIFYAGPAKTPKNYVSGSLGPTTAERMDSYLEILMKNGASLITIAKGNRSNFVPDLCQKFKGFYLGTIGGTAALLAKKFIKQSEIIDFESLGMEAVRKIVVKDFPAFIVCNDKGQSLYGNS